jgi:hypothetical protein
MSLVQIEEGYRSWRMKANPALVFQARKSEGGGWYYLIYSDGSRQRHTASVVESLAEPIPVEVK